MKNSLDQVSLDERIITKFIAWLSNWQNIKLHKYIFWLIAALEIIIPLFGMFWAWHFFLRYIQSYLLSFLEFIPSVVVIILLIGVLIRLSKKTKIVNIAALVITITIVIGIFYGLYEFIIIVKDSQIKPKLEFIFGWIVVLMVIYITLSNIFATKMLIRDLCSFIPDWVINKLFPHSAAWLIKSQFDQIVQSLRDQVCEKNSFRVLNLDLKEDSKFIILSDCHRGLGDRADEFAWSESVFVGALNHYLDKEFTYIELGDGEELWENGEDQNDAQHNTDIGLAGIFTHHKRSYEVIQKFADQIPNKLYLLAGNHDDFRHQPNFYKKNCKQVQFENGTSFLKNYEHDVYDAIMLKMPNNNQDGDQKKEILLVHGHHGDLNSDRHIPISSWFVNKVWKPLQLIGISDPTRASLNKNIADVLHSRIAEWAWNNKKHVIVGHTHVPHLAEQKNLSEKNNYFYTNTGSCINLGGITGIEISKITDEDRSNSPTVNDNPLIMRLIRWDICSDNDPTSKAGSKISLAIMRSVIGRRIMDESFWTIPQ